MPCILKLHVNVDHLPLLETIFYFDYGQVLILIKPCDLRHRVENVTKAC